VHGEGEQGLHGRGWEGDDEEAFDQALGHLIIFVIGGSMHIVQTAIRMLQILRACGNASTASGNTQGGPPE
jgi:hypothetical protein